MMFIKFDGVEYQGFTESIVRKSLLEISRAFNFRATSDKFSDLFIERGQDIEIFIDDNKVITGFIDKIDINYDANTHSINVSGRDKTGVIVDSSLPDKRVFNAPISLKKVIDNVLSQFSLGIKAVDDVLTIPLFKKTLESNEEDTAFDFMSRYAAKANVLLTSDNNSNIVITKTGVDFIETILLNQKGQIKNNILSANITFDDSHRFGKYTVYAQQIDDVEISNKNQASQKGVALDTSDNINSARQKILILEQEGDISACQDRAIWAANMAKAKAFKYTCTVQGHYHDDNKKDLWDINKIVRVVDDFAGIDEFLLIETIEYSTTLQGTFTNLTLVPPGAFA